MAGEKAQVSPTGRGLYAVLTEEGLEALRPTWPVYAGGIAEHFGRPLTDEEVEVLQDRAVLVRIISTPRLLTSLPPRN